MDLDAYLAWKGRIVRVRDEVTFRQPHLLSLSEQPWELVEAVEAEREADAIAHWESQSDPVSCAIVQRRPNPKQPTEAFRDLP